jgi:hypothetical protein
MSFEQTHEKNDMVTYENSFEPKVGIDTLKNYDIFYLHFR